MKLSVPRPTVEYFDDPLVEVGENIEVPEPKMGWVLLGPWSKNARQQINLGIIGDSKSLEDAKNFLSRLDVSTPGKNETLLHVDFPSLNKLGIKFHIQSTSEISKEELEQLDETSSFSERVTISSNIIKEKIAALMEKDPAPDVLILTYPKKMDDYCIEGSKGTRINPKKSPLEKYIEKKQSKHTILDCFTGISLPSKEFKLMDLRSAIKTTCMDYNIPIQIIRPETIENLDSEKTKQEDDATIFWNLVVAIFYKANHIPWRVKGLMSDTCYVGISFFRDRDDPSSAQTSLAQVFLETEGFVFKGKKAVTDERKIVDGNNLLHVSKGDAIQLIQNIIKVYKRNNNGKLPSRIVIHKTSRYNKDEINGFMEGAKEIHKLDLLTLGDRDIRLVRWGKHPPIRGTSVKLPDDSILLYTSGYIPYLDVYPGPHVPLPLQILEHHGDAPTDLICKEILALTKLNWNGAKFCIREPITIYFAEKVGKILRESPPDFEVKGAGEKFKFYI